MSNLMILVWQRREPEGQPDVEVKIPVSLAKWVPRLMRFMPKKAREETWGKDVDFEGMMADLENLAAEASRNGTPELMSVKSKDGYVKITVEK